MIERTRVNLAGTNPRVVRAGDAESREAVVFVHGNPGSADDWEPFVAAAADAVGRAVALDMPDFGETSAPEGFEHTVAGYAAWLGGALDELGIERAHLVLHDFGGPFGLAWAAGAPERLASITLIDTGVLPGYRWHRLARIWRRPVLGEIFQATATRRAFRFMLNRSEPQGLSREFLDRMYDFYDRRTRRAVLRLYRATDNPDELSAVVTEALRPHDVPALVVWGEHDSYLPASYAARQREAFPSADVHVLPTSGHWPFVDAAPTVERLLTTFLSGVRPGTPAA